MTDTLTHAITTHQPLSWAIAAGHCPIINSTTRPGLEHIGKLVGIHASRHFDSEEEVARHPALLAACRAAVNAVAPWNPPCGALLGVARLVGVVRESREYPGQFCRLLGRGPAVDPLDMALNGRIRPWWRGPWGLLIETEEEKDKPLLLPEPIPMRGAGGVWRIPDIDCDDHAEMRWIRASEWALEQWRKARGT